VAFREAHHAVGRLVRRLEAEGKSLDAASYGDLESIDARFTAEDLSVLARHHVPPIDEQLAKLRELLG
jgi:argininosuccinate lyase